MTKLIQAAVWGGLIWTIWGINPAQAKTAIPTEIPAPVVTTTPMPSPTAGIPSLEEVIRKNNNGKFNGLNSIRKAEVLAVDEGVAANTIVLLLMLPLIATIVSLLHYFLGLSGYGIFMPTMIAVAFLATGIVGGLVLFAMIMAISLLSNMTLRKLKLHFWPSRSINLMFISLGTFGLMVISRYVPLLQFSKISIFPILFMILLAEEFVRTQLAKSRSEAQKLMVGTLILAIFGAGMMSYRAVQETVLRNPEIILFGGLAINLIVGNYSGIRFSEISRFRKAIRTKKIIRNKI